MKNQKSFELKLTQTQKIILDSCIPLIDHAVKEEKKRVFELSKNCAIECTKKAQEIIKEIGIDKAMESNLSIISKYILLKEFTEKEFKFKSNSILGSVFYQSFSQSHHLRKTDLIINSSKKEILTEENKLDYKIEFSQELFDKALTRYWNHYKLMMTSKLTEATLKYVTTNFISVKDITIGFGAKGFQITCILYSKDMNQHKMYTKAISAGGHSIQCFHYRYITNIY